MTRTGLRWNEARNIKWEDIDLKGDRIRIKEIVDGPQDIVYILGSLHKRFTENAESCGYVFQSD
ncbi:MAG TPA: site-specific integrase [Desulfuromonadales bacterium]|nr:site-specific integrase [Desulfuromonadales bacterium]